MTRMKTLLTFMLVMIEICVICSVVYAAEQKTPDSATLVPYLCDTLVKMQYPLLENATLNESLQKMARLLAEAAEKPIPNLSIVVLNDASPNIFSLPNQIYITTGLLDVLSSKDELSYLMGKEIAYLSDRTHLNFYESEKGKKKAIRWITGALSFLATVAGPVVGAYVTFPSYPGVMTTATTSITLTQQLIQTGFNVLSDVIKEVGTQAITDYRQAVKVETVLDNQIAGLKRQAILAKQGGKEEAYQRLSADVKRLDSQRENYIQQVRQQNPRYAALYFPQPVMPKEVPTVSGEYLLRYKVTDSSLLIWLVKDATLVHMETVQLKRETLREKVQGYLQPLQGVSSHAQLAKFDMKLSNELYGLLFRPVADKIPDSAHVIIVADDILEVLPFESLIVILPDRLEMTQGEYGPFPKGVTYLADRVRLSYYYSATAMRLIRQGTKDSSLARSLFMMADPTLQTEGQSLAQREVQQKLMTMAKKEEWISLQDQFSPLPYARELANRLKLLFPDSRVLVGVDAKKDNLTDIEKYRYVVFATHGILAKELPYLVEPALLLSPEEGSEEDIRPRGFLTVSEVMKLNLACDNVSLTACSTGLGRRTSGEGVMSMGWAFQYAGAKSVLVSLWNVEEQSTILLTGKFFEHIKAGKDKMISLTDARAELRRMGYEHPFYWAPFILIGEID